MLRIELRIELKLGDLLGRLSKQDKSKVSKLGADLSWRSGLFRAKSCKLQVASCKLQVASGDSQVPLTVCGPQLLLSAQCSVLSAQCSVRALRAGGMRDFCNANCRL